MGLAILGMLGKIELEVLAIHRKGFNLPSQGLQLIGVLANFLFDLEGTNPQILELGVFSPVLMSPIPFKKQIPPH